MSSRSTLITFEAHDIKNDLQRNGCIESIPVKFVGLSWCIIVSKFTSIDGVKSICVGIRCQGPSKSNLLPKNRKWSCHIYAQLKVIRCGDMFSRNPWSYDLNEDLNQDNYDKLYIFEEWSKALNPIQGFIENGKMIFEADISMSKVQIDNMVTVEFLNMHDVDENLGIRCHWRASYDKILSDLSYKTGIDTFNLRLCYIDKSQKLVCVFTPSNNPTLNTMFGGRLEPPFVLFFEKMKHTPILPLIDKQTETDFLSKCDSRRNKLYVYLMDKDKDASFAINAFSNWSYGQLAEKAGEVLRHDPYMIQFYKNHNGVVGDPFYPNLKTSVGSMAGIENDCRRSTCSFFFRKIHSKTVEYVCPICFDNETKNWLSTMCGHIFCGDCLNQSFRKSRECPTCRYPLKSRAYFHPIFF